MNIFIVIMVIVIIVIAIAINIVIVITIMIIIVIEVILFAVIEVILFAVIMVIILNLQEVSLAARLPIKVLKDHFFATRDCNDNCEEGEDDKYYYADYDHII